MLHNMSMRPQTQVDWDLFPVGEALVRFELASIKTVLAESPTWGIAKEIAEGAPAPMRDTTDGDLQATLARCLDEAWQEYGLQGAIHIFPWPAAQAIAAHRGFPPILRAMDPALVLNVLARSRSQLLLPSMPLALEPAFLTRELATDDPRLAELARRSFSDGGE